MKLNALLGSVLIVGGLALPAFAADSAAPADADVKAKADLQRHMSEAKEMMAELKALPSAAKGKVSNLDAAAKAKLKAKVDKMRARVQKLKDWSAGLKAEGSAAKAMMLGSIIKKAEAKLDALDPDKQPAAKP